MPSDNNVNIDYATILIYQFPNSKWTLDGDSYDGLTWLSDDEKPNKEDLDALWPETLATISKKQKEKEIARAEILAKLGLSEDEAKVLLG